MSLFLKVAAIGCVGAGVYKTYPYVIRPPMRTLRLIVIAAQI